MPLWRELSLPLKGEDAGMCARHSDALCAALADGVGSYSGGGLAASLVVDLLRQRFLEAPQFDMAEAFSDCKALLESLSQDLRLGTTLTVMVLRGGVVSFGHVGDCRIYLLRGQGIQTITRDQTELAYLLDRGVLNKFDAKNYRRANVLMSVLAPGKGFELQLGRVEVLKGDRLVLCSDGFYKVISKRDILNLSTNNGFEDFAKKLEDQVSGVDRDDDASAFVFELD